MSEYTLVLECDAQYWDGDLEFDVDFTNKNCPTSQRELMVFFQHCNIESALQLGRSFLYRSRAGELVEKYKYDFEYSYNNFITEDKAVVEITIFTDALGSHLSDILDSVQSTVESFGDGFGIWLSTIGYRDTGWKKIDARRLVDCKHKEYNSLAFAQKGDDLVEVCKCSSCRKTFYKIVEEQ